MDLFTLIMSYINDYIVVPISSYLGDYGDTGNYLSDYYLYFYDSKFTLGYIDSVYTDSNGNTFNITGVNLQELIIFIITIVIFILLFIVAVKFIVWLFKQISFITRF